MLYGNTVNMILYVCIMSVLPLTLWLTIRDKLVYLFQLNLI